MVKILPIPHDSCNRSLLLKVTAAVSEHEEDTKLPLLFLGRHFPGATAQCGRDIQYA